MIGISYPLQINDTGNFEISAESDLISEHILSWFETHKNERVQPDYGIPNLIGSDENFGSLEATIKRDLINEFPNLSFSITIEILDDGLYQIGVYYKDSNDLRNEIFITVNPNA